MDREDNKDKQIKYLEHKIDYLRFYESNINTQAKQILRKCEDDLKYLKST